jgi:16S rRNA (guanine966-N2)-methyltransferase
VADAGRVIAGSAKGIRLVAPGEGTRPLSDRVKESLFGALEAEGVIGPGRAFLDLFAGSGAAGIEALSRGCDRAVLVESDSAAVRVIEANLARTALTGGSLVRMDVLRLLGYDGAAQGGPFSAVLVDPPYATDLLAPALERLAEPAAEWLTGDAVVVAKHFWRDAPQPQIGRLQRFRERRFGETMLTFYGQVPAGGRYASTSTSPKGAT